MPERMNKMKERMDELNFIIRNIEGKHNAKRKNAPIAAENLETIKTSKF